MRSARNGYSVFCSEHSSQLCVRDWFLKNSNYVLVPRASYQGIASAIPCPAQSDAPLGAGRGPSVGCAATYAVHLSQKVNLRRAFDSGPRHFGLEFVGGKKGSRPFQILPFEEKRDVINLSCAAENPATALALFLPPTEVGIESRLPRHIVRDLVVDKNVDHDLLALLSP